MSVTSAAFVRFFTALVVGPLALHAGCAGADGSVGGTGGGGSMSVDAGEDAGVGAWHPFFLLIAFTRAWPVPRTPAQQVEGSETIVQGFLDDVMDGRVIDYATGASNPLATAVFRIRVEEVIKGEETQYAYAEFIRAGIPVDRMAELMPRDIPMVFLLRHDTWDETTYRFEHEGRGLPEGETLLTFVYPSGIALEGADGIDYPLAEHPADDIFESNTLAALIQELSELARE